MALSGELQTAGFASSAKMRADEMRNNQRVSGKYAMSKKEPLITKKELVRLAFVVVGVIALTVIVGSAMKASQKAGYTSDSHGNVSYEQMNTYEEPGSEITKGM